MTCIAFHHPAFCRLLWVGLLLLVLPGCSIRRLAVNRLGDALAAGGATFASDEDPDLVRDAAPFSLKTMEALLGESPRHVGLRRAAAAGFAQYAYAFVQMPADETESDDFAASERLRDRARRLFLRARAHGLRGLEVRIPNFESQLRSHAETAVRHLSPPDVPLVFWVGASWAAAIAQSKDDPELVAELPLVASLMDRAAELDPDWNNGAIHSFFIPFEMTRPGSPPDAASKALASFEKARALSKGSLAAPYVSLAESVAVPHGDRAMFESLLGQAMQIRIDDHPGSRLENLVMQRRARWLMSRIDELFVRPPRKELKSP